MYTNLQSGLRCAGGLYHRSGKLREKHTPCDVLKRPPRPSRTILERSATCMPAYTSRHSFGGIFRAGGKICVLLQSLVSTSTDLDDGELRVFRECGIPTETRHRSGCELERILVVTTSDVRPSISTAAAKTCSVRVHHCHHDGGMHPMYLYYCIYIFIRCRAI